MFMFSIADKKHKSIREIESWGVAEIMEWVAYYSLQDDKKKAKLEAEIVQEQPDIIKENTLRAFFSKFSKKNK